MTEREHIGMRGEPCQCTPHLRRKARRGCPSKCPDCNNTYRKCTCAHAHPCYGGCGRRTNMFESTACGYCVHCAADRRWQSIE